MRFRRYNFAFIRVSAAGRRFNCPLLPVSLLDEYESALADPDPGERHRRLCAVLGEAIPGEFRANLEAATPALLSELATALFLGEPGSEVRRRSEAFLRCHAEAGALDEVFERLLTTRGISPDAAAKLSLPLAVELAEPSVSGEPPPERGEKRSEEEYAAARNRLLRCVEKISGPA